MIVRQVLTALNEAGESCLRERREVLKRVVGFESFSGCWDSDRLKTKGLIAKIQKVVNVKDSFTRMSQERENERNKRLLEMQSEQEKIREQKAKIGAIKTELHALFNEANQHKREQALEGVLNSLFSAHGIAVREAMTVVEDAVEGVVEQIDEVVELDNHLYFVEMKWWEKVI